MTSQYSLLGPRTRTDSWPAPAPYVSTINLLSKVCMTPLSTPGPYTRTFRGSGGSPTGIENGLPAAIMSVVQLYKYLLRGVGRLTHDGCLQARGQRQWRFQDFTGGVDFVNLGGGGENICLISLLYYHLQKKLNTSS